jgi:hypothetical protein
LDSSESIIVNASSSHLAGLQPPLNITKTTVRFTRREKLEEWWD